MNRPVDLHKLALTLALPIAASSLACASAAPEDSSDARETNASTAEAISASDYAYFFAERARGGFVVRPVNGGRVACDPRARGRSESCSVSAVDLSPLGISDDDSRAILATLDGGWEARSIVFLGSIAPADATVTRITSRTPLALRVVEAWRAPRIAPYGGTFYHVTRDGISCGREPCDAATALRLNVWRSFTAPHLDLRAAPPDARCRFLPETSQPCAAPYDLPNAAAALPAGLLVAAFRDYDGSLYATQYFVRIGVGGTCDDGGLSYCGEGTTCVPESGICTEYCAPGRNCRHGRGRGVMPYIRPIEILDWQALVLQTAP